MKFRTLVLPIAFALLVSGSAEAKFCSSDEVPAATLLLPYFEVDVDDPNGLTTLFSINNAFDTAALVHVTLWTDWGIPTLEFHVYLTGYDVQTINLRDVFSGNLPRTAGDAQDPTDSISPRGFLSQDGDFTTCANVLPYPGVDTIPALLKSEMRLAHRGGNAAQIFGGCLAENHGDDRVRGYVTIDVVTGCVFDYPSSEGYFDGVASRENRLWGSVTYVDSANNSAQQESLVHIEACDPAQPNCPTGPGSYTFYGRYVNFDGSDDREPLATVFTAGFLNGGPFSAGTSLLVWRDTKRPASGIDGAAPCIQHRRPSWYPLQEQDVVTFDEQENPLDHCVHGDVIIPPPDPRGCFPIATQKVLIGEESALGPPVAPFEPFGWVYLNLNHGLGPNDPMPGRAQAWVMAVSAAHGRYSTAADAVRLDSACTPGARSTLIP